MGFTVIIVFSFVFEVYLGFLVVMNNNLLLFVAGFSMFVIEVIFTRATHCACY